jgi:hypothetical protein
VTLAYIDDGVPKTTILYPIDFLPPGKAARGSARSSLDAGDSSKRRGLGENA